MPRKIEYGNLMHRAMRGLIADVLADVARHGLPGEHHFFITFDTAAPGVEMADWLRARYPEEMTIVIQHWFEDLDVRPDGFSITLNFGDRPEPLSLPYDAILTFVDPSVEFGLRFETHERDEDEDDDEAPMAEIAEEDAPRPAADVVSLDAFRK
jgi:hypothetical protein